MVVRDNLPTMKFILTLLLALVIGSSGLHAGDKPVVQAMIAKDSDTKPTDVFSPNVPKLYAFFRSTGTVKGDKLRFVWIAEDVGTAAPLDTKIDEAELAADSDNFNGAASLTKPDKGWPPGKYRVDIYLGDDLITSVKFTIDAAKTSD
jgi:hypothetical protein